MPFITQAELTVDVPTQRAFDRLADVASWPRWMPRSFRPVASRGVIAPMATRIGGERLDALVVALSSEDQIR